jgi:DNA sulfur modification protein DndB
MYNEEGLPPNFRAQRTLNRRRVPEIARYILDNSESYVFSALTVSVDSEVEFNPLEGDGSQNQTGILRVPASAKFVINDGQHRRAAIVEAIKENISLGKESIPLVIFVDSDLRLSQQMFADLNRYAVRPTKSLSILYDRRDPIAAATLEIIAAVPIFRSAVEFQKTSISNRSSNLFTLSNVYQAVCKLLGKKKGDGVSFHEKNLALDYWSALTAIIPGWNEFALKQVKGSYLRKKYVHSHGVVLVALGMAGHVLVAQHPEDWRDCLEYLGTMDWERSNSQLWEGVTMESGKISKAHRNLRLTSILLKDTMKLELTNEEMEFKRETLRRREST